MRVYITISGSRTMCLMSRPKPAAESISQTLTSIVQSHAVTCKYCITMHIQTQGRSKNMDYLKYHFVLTVFISRPFITFQYNS